MENTQVYAAAGEIKKNLVVFLERAVYQNRPPENRTSCGSAAAVVKHEHDILPTRISVIQTGDRCNACVRPDPTWRVAVAQQRRQRFRLRYTAVQQYDCSATSTFSAREVPPRSRQKVKVTSTTVSTKQ